MSLAATLPLTISWTEGSTRSVTDASSHRAATDRTTSRPADGIARSTWSTSKRATSRGMSFVVPRTRTPKSVRPTFEGSSSTMATGSSPTDGLRTMSFRTIAPASPAPTTRTRASVPTAARRRRANRRLWNRIAPNPTKVRNGPNTITDLGRNWEAPSSSHATSISAYPIATARTTLRASSTLAYRHICS